MRTEDVPEPPTATAPTAPAEPHQPVPLPHQPPAAPIAVRKPVQSAKSQPRKGRVRRRN
jgi:hypothetical protein